jgi:hypothetical protein
MLGKKSLNVTVTFNNFHCDTGVPDVITTLTPFVRIFSYLSLVAIHPKILLVLSSITLLKGIRNLGIVIDLNHHTIKIKICLYASKIEKLF